MHRYNKFTSNSQKSQDVILFFIEILRNLSKITYKNLFMFYFPDIPSAISLKTGAQSVADEFPSSLKTTITYSGFSDG